MNEILQRVQKVEDLEAEVRCLVGLLACFVDRIDKSIGQTDQHRRTHIKRL